ncbi:MULTISPECIES: hypothetical protein [Vreelandella]|jgi:hypothetical protein|uniref:Uncharacterized protein n=1 Tax=Vreelandella neptunia TaxID=115551 RepID=A0ABZ0YHM5_9GAMM|nr:MULTISPECIES: hypothetical protein [Halomonas]MDN3559617.1 hypothetical protein [Halomonas neptunia]NVE91858.1 hypothetical protein [Halomonas titanicae]WQH11605.1 hypothetical protein SR894_15750 [Halomonas neptunia]|tara:strand:- start:220 stop:630 length:411 start_codon:yes stop_codon:yes gene_type:complete
METLGIAISLVMAGLIIATPIYCVAKSRSFIRLNLISIPIIFTLVIAGAYWPHFYKDVRLEMMGLDFDGMSDEERTRNVTPEQKEEAIELYWSLMGIGWPLQAIIGMVLVLPYPSTVWLVGFGAKRVFRRKTREIN